MPTSATAGGRRSLTKTYASPKTRSMVASAARSCSPMNDPCRSPPSMTNSTVPHAIATTPKPTRNVANAANRARVSMNAAAPRASTESRASLPAAVSASAPFAIELTTISRAKAAVAAKSHGEGTVRRFLNCLTASAAVTSSATSAGPIATCVPPVPNSTLGRSAALNRQSPTVVRKTAKGRSVADSRVGRGSRLGIRRNYDRRP